MIDTHLLRVCGNSLGVHPSNSRCNFWGEEYRLPAFDFERLNSGNMLIQKIHVMDLEDEDHHRE